MVFMKEPDSISGAEDARTKLGASSRFSLFSSVLFLALEKSAAAASSVHVWRGRAVLIKC